MKMKLEETQCGTKLPFKKTKMKKWKKKRLAKSDDCAFSPFKELITKSSLRLPCNLDMDYRRNTKWGPDLIS